MQQPIFFLVRSGLRIKTATENRSNLFKWYIFIWCRLWIVDPCAVCPVSWEALAWQFNHACAHARMHLRTSPDGICGWHSALHNSTYFNYSSSLSFQFNHHHGNRAAAVTHTYARPKINKNPHTRVCVCAHEQKQLFWELREEDSIVFPERLRI